MENWFYNGWQPLAHTALVGLLAYIGLIALLRISGRRTLSKMNAFDFSVTVALGSTLASALLNRNVVLAQALVAFALLIGAQFVVTWLSVRVAWVQKAITGEPALLVYRGALLTDALRKARVTHAEVLAAGRASGCANLSDISALVLETDGSFSVISGVAPHTDIGMAPGNPNSQASGAGT